MNLEFEKFASIKRLSREMVVTEKIDGTNAQICISETDEFLVGSAGFTDALGDFR